MKFHFKKQEFFFETLFSPSFDVLHSSLIVYMDHTELIFQDLLLYCTKKVAESHNQFFHFRHGGETHFLVLAQTLIYVTSQDSSTATGRHYNSPGHTLADLSITVLEQVRKNDTLYRTQREEYHVRRFNTLYKGLNRQI